MSYTFYVKGILYYYYIKTANRCSTELIISLSDSQRTVADTESVEPFSVVEDYNLSKKSSPEGKVTVLSEYCCFEVKKT